VTELYSIRDVSRLFAIQESRLRYWMQSGFVGPTVRKGGRFYYTFADLVGVKAAKDLLAAGLTVQQVRKNLLSLRAALPKDANPAARLRICSDGETVVALADDVAFEPRTGQVVMAFNLPALAGQLAQLRPEPAAPPPLANGTGPVMLAANDAVPKPVEDDPTDATGAISSYRCFLEACACEDRGETDVAEHLYRQALELQPSLAAARTNLGNLCYRRGELTEARVHYEAALDAEPHQAEARYNLGNLLDDLGETELAIAELRRVTLAAPEFADAHYNLGLLLARVGGMAQAQRHLQRYLELDGGSEWAARAKSYLADLAA
jgi:tetratricopeptide (TPR) repeat protein